MKTYSPIATTGSYLELISKIAPKEFSLLLRDENNYIFAWQVDQKLEIDNDNADFKEMDKFIAMNRGEYIFNILSYDLKNSIYPNLKSENSTSLSEEKSQLKTYKNVIICNNEEYLYFGNSTISEIEAELLKSRPSSQEIFETKSLMPIEDQSTYSNKVKALKSKIQQGDIYEVNYCTSFNLLNSNIDAVESFKNIQIKTQAPFSAFIMSEELQILCGSPERFLMKDQNNLYSQPIKGTAKKSENEEEDAKMIMDLNSSVKERAENIMIVDLVRNDLSKIATKNTVQVKELSKLYTFKSVHQLISTISCQVDDKIEMSDILCSMFPMGSMTGAPKLNAMKFSETHEEFKRGFYSGSLGLIEPNGNFDLNVIIRSLVYDNKSKNGKIGVGGAITILSDSEAEYEECFIKLKAIKEALC